MLNTPRANRLHISIFGRRNVGKSSLINAITGQQIALVSDVAGTTTDPVYKSMELLPIGPVVFIDTAGLDDIGEIGSLRKRKTIEVMDKTDFAILVFSVENEDISLERNWFDQLKSRNIPVIGVINKMELK
ncbi:MAG: GTP-binding protein, partial [Thermoanaerobacterales bacterium]|nr:GTP-binding protein [Thermoanaerobacterales bacterium]